MGDMIVVPIPGAKPPPPRATNPTGAGKKSGTANPTDDKRKAAAIPLPKWSVGGAAGALFQIPTPLTEKGYGGFGELRLAYTRNHSRFSLGASTHYVQSKMKLLPTGGDASEITSNHLSVRLTLGNDTFQTAFRTKEGSPWGVLTTGIHPYFGFGLTKVPSYDRTVGGETITVEGASEKTFDIGTIYRAGLGFRVGKRTLLNLGPELGIGLNYGGESSEFNRLAIHAGLSLSFMIGGKTEAEQDAAAGLSTLGLSYALAFLLHRDLQRYYMNKVLNDPAEQAQDAGLMGVGDDPGNMADVPTLQSLVGLFGAYGRASQMKLYMNAGKLNWLLMVAEALSGIGFLFSKGTAGKAGGFGDMIHASGMGIYALHNIDQPKRRSAMEKKLLLKKARNAFLWRAALNTAMNLIGMGIVASSPDNKWGRALVSGSVSTQGGMALSALPFKAPGLSTTTAVTYVPVSLYRGRDMKGSRGGFNITTSIDGTFLRADLLVMGPMLTIKTTGERADPDEPPDDPTLPSELGVAIMFHKRWKYFDIGAGLEQGNQFGGSGGYVGLLGAKASAEVTIPVGKKWGFSLGVLGRVHWLFPKNKTDPDNPKTGYQWEIAPYLGAYFQ